MKITRQMVVELNDELRHMGCCFRYRYEEGFGNSSITLEPVSMNYIENYIINPNEKFFDWIENWFLSKGISLTYNNTRNTMWSITGWK